MPKKLFRVVYAMNYLMQAAFCLLFPAGVCIGFGWLAVHRWGVGVWAMIVAIIAGVLIGFFSMISFLLKSAHAIDPTASEGDEKHDGTTAKK